MLQWVCVATPHRLTHGRAEMSGGTVSHRRSLDMAIDLHSLFSLPSSQEKNKNAHAVHFYVIDSQRQFRPSGNVDARLSRGCQERPTLELVILSLLQESLCCYNAMLSG